MDKRSRSEFGEFVKGLRVRGGMTLRGFCLENGVDAGNWCRMEGGVVKPPGHRVLEGYGKMLGLEEGSEGWYRMLDLGAAGRGEVPADLMSDAELVKKLPVVFCCLRRGVLLDFVERVRQEWEVFDEEL